MKKLLSFLAVLGLTTTAVTSVIACTDKSKDPIPGPGDGNTNGDYSDSLKMYQDTISTIFSSVMQKNASKLVMQVDMANPDQNESGYQFLNYEVLKEYLKRGETEISFAKDSPELSGFQTDLYSLYPDDSWNQEITTKIKNNDSLQNLIPKDGNVLGTYQVDDLVINISQNSSDSKDFAISVKSHFKRFFNYLAEDGKTAQSFDSSQYLTAIITSNERIVKVIQTVQDELPTKLISVPNAEGGTQFKYSELKGANEKLKAYGYIDDTVVNAINNKDEINGKVYNNIFSYTQTTLRRMFESDDATVEISGDLADSGTFSTIGSYLGDDAYTNSKFVSDITNNQFMNKLIFKTKDESEYLDEDTAVSDMRQIFTTIGSPTFGNSLKTFLKQNGADQTQIDSLANTAYSYGYFNLDNITIKISEDYPAITVPRISVPWVYEANLAYGNNRETNFLGAYYDALKVVNTHTVQLNALDKVNEVLFQATDSFKEAFLGDLILKGINDTSNGTLGVSVAQINDWFNQNPESSAITLGISSYKTNYFTFSAVEDEINQDPFYQFEGYHTFVQNPLLNNLDPLVIRKTRSGKIGLGYANIVTGYGWVNTFDWKQNIGNARMNFYFPFGFYEDSVPWHDSSEPVSELTKLKDGLKSSVDDFLLWELN